MKFKAKAKDCQLIIKVKTSFGEIIDEKELDRFSRVFLRGFLKPRLIKKKQIEYTGPIGVSLYERLKEPITKREFLFIIEQVVVAVHKLHANNMAINNFIMDIHNVYFNESTKEVQFLYVPTTTGQQNTNLIQFIETIVYSTKPAGDKDMEFVSRFLYSFRTIKPFDILKVEQLVLKEDRSVVNTIRRQNAGQSGFMTDKPQHYYEYQEGKKDKADNDDPTGLLGENEATGILNEDEATGLLDDFDEATGLLSDEDEATGLLCENNANIHYPSLFRVLSNEVISVNKPVFRLGKERSYVDYFVTNNIAVSRSHADIITRGNRYFVKDLNSKNHTYINGQELPVHTEVEIHDGDNLKLGNEEFIFSV